MDLLQVSLALVLAVLAAAEEQLPERFLPPRDFNPHPFERGSAPSPRPRSRSRLPAGEGDGAVPSGAGEILEPHPYALLARKRPREGRYPHHRPGDPVLYPHPTSVLNELHRSAARAKLQQQKQEEQLHYQQQTQQQPASSNDVVYPDDGKQSLYYQQPILLYEPQEPSQHLQDDVEHHSSADNYAFSYSVRDAGSGDDFAHAQARNGGGTRGEYRVRLPDGRLQIVSYIADSHGYRADVRYDEGLRAEAGSRQHSAAGFHHRQQHQQQYPAVHQYVHPSPNPEISDDGVPQTHQYVHASPSPAPLSAVHQYVHASPSPTPLSVAHQYVHASPSPAPLSGTHQYVHASPSPAPLSGTHQYVHASPSPAPLSGTHQYVHASPSPAPLSGTHQYVHASPSPAPLSAGHNYIQASPSPEPTGVHVAFQHAQYSEPQYLQQYVTASPLQYLDDTRYIGKDDGFFVTPATPTAAAVSNFRGNDGGPGSSILVQQPVSHGILIPTSASPPAENTASPAPVQFPQVPDDDQSTTTSPATAHLSLSGRHSRILVKHRFA